MKQYIYFLVFLFLLFPHMVFSEGFAAGTFVKTPMGYQCIENLSVGDVVICFDNKKNLVERFIVDTTKKHVDRYVMVNIGGEYIAAACDQKFYSMRSGSWVSVVDLKINDVLVVGDGNACSVEGLEIRNVPADMYGLSIAEHHNFFVSKANVCAHNFAPVVVLEVCVAFGLGVIEFVSASFGLAGLGAYFGYQVHKKSKQNNLVIGKTAFELNDTIIYSHDKNNDAQAPGMPTAEDGYFPPKKWDGKKVNSPNGRGHGWPDKDGNIWVPTGPKGHGGPHWDVQSPRGKSYRNILPGGKER